MNEEEIISHEKETIEINKEFENIKDALSKPPEKPPTDGNFKDEAGGVGAEGDMGVLRSRL